MAADETELTFIRCPSCRSLVPAIASRCRMCGHVFKQESDSAAASEAGQQKSRVRQRTISVTSEQVQTYLEVPSDDADVDDVESIESADDARTTDGSSAEVSTVDTLLAVPTINGGLKPEPVVPEPVVPEPVVPEPVVPEPVVPDTAVVKDPAKSAEDAGDGAPFRLGGKRPGEIARVIALSSAQEGEAPAAAPKVAPLAPQQDWKEESVDESRLDDDFDDADDELEDEDGDGTLGFGSADTGNDPAAPRKRKRRRKKKRRDDLGVEGVDQSGNASQQGGGSQQQGGGGRQGSYSKQQAAPSAQAPTFVASAAPDVAPQARAPERVHSVAQNQYQERGTAPARSEGPRAETPAPEIPAPEPLAPEPLAPEPLAPEPPAPEPRHQPEMRHTEVKMEQQGQGAGQQQQRNSGWNQDAKKTSEPRNATPVAAGDGVLVGWLVNYNGASAGISSELRDSRFFVGRQQLRQTDFVVDYEGVSTPHCLVTVVKNEGVFIQDLMSEHGTQVRKVGENGYTRRDEPTKLGHGDWVKLGHYEVMVCLLPFDGAQGGKQR